MKAGKLIPRVTTNKMYCEMLKRATRSAHTKQFSQPLSFCFDLPHTEVRLTFRDRASST